MLPRSTFLFGSLAVYFAISSASALTLTFWDGSPTPGPCDAHNFSGASKDANNVNDGGTYGDGTANDAFTYVAGDRPDQGQTFTTGSHAKGYWIKAVWVRQVGYTNNTKLTYWDIAAGVKVTVRVTDPMLGGANNFAVLTDTYETRGDELSTHKNATLNGPGTWIKFTFSTPTVLLPDKTYGFDVCSSQRTFCFEWLGTSDSDTYIGGGAYNGNTQGVPDNGLNGLKGDRVFLVELAECN